MRSSPRASRTRCSTSPAGIHSGSPTSATTTGLGGRSGRRGRNRMACTRRVVRSSCTRRTWRRPGMPSSAIATSISFGCPQRRQSSRRQTLARNGQRSSRQGFLATRTISLSGARVTVHACAQRELSRRTRSVGSSLATGCGGRHADKTPEATTASLSTALSTRQADNQNALNGEAATIATDFFNLRGEFGPTLDRRRPRRRAGIGGRTPPRAGREPRTSAHELGDEDARLLRRRRNSACS